MYDPIIARWLIPDPYRQYWSPFMAMGNNPINLIDPDGGMDGDPKLGDFNGQGQVFTSDGWVTPLGEVTVFAPREFKPLQEPIAQDAVRFVFDPHPVSDELNRFLERSKGGIFLHSKNGTGEIHSDGIAERSGNIDILDDAKLTNSKFTDFIKAFTNLFGTEHEKVHQPKPTMKDSSFALGTSRIRVGDHIELGTRVVHQKLNSRQEIIQSDTTPFIFYKNLGKR